MSELITIIQSALKCANHIVESGKTEDERIFALQEKGKILDATKRALNERSGKGASG